VARLQQLKSVPNNYNGVFVNSESHLRQMRVFADNPYSVLDEFSQEFERGFLETLSSLHGTKRVKANTVYQEYIADKHHIHMNATKWTTLTGLCMHLGKESKAIVDETEKGWFIQYVDRDPKVLARQAQSEQRQKFELDEEERRKREIAVQVQAAEERRRAEGGDNNAEEGVDNSMVRGENDQKVTVALAPVVTATLGLKKRPRQAVGFGGDSDDDDAAPASKAPATAVNTSNGTFPGVPSARTAGGATHMASSSAMASGGVLAQMIKEDEARKRAREGAHQPAATTTVRSGSNNADSGAHGSVSNPDNGKGYKDDGKATTSKSWLYRNLIVKVVNKEVGRGKLYKQKGRVVRVLGRDYDEAEVDIDGELHVLRVRDLETSVPKVRVHGSNRTLRLKFDGYLRSMRESV
jgi:DNA/RNA-binding protein KIN17